MLGVMPGSCSTLRTEALLRSISAGRSSPRWRPMRPHADTATRVAQATARAARVIGAVTLPRAHPSAEEVPEPVADPPAGRSDRAPAAAHRILDVVSDRGPARAVKPAGLARLGVDEERLEPDPGGARGRQAPGRPGDLGPGDPVR